MAVTDFKPFLGPIFAWVSAVPKGSVLRLPAMVQVIIRFLLLQVMATKFRCDVGDYCGYEEGYQESFRADAKADGDDVAIGGWETLWGQTTQGGQVVRHQAYEEKCALGILTR